MPTGRIGPRGSRRDLWPWISLLPFGLGSWAPIIAGVRCRRWSWTLIGAACFALFILALTRIHPGAPQSSQGGPGGLLLLSWVCGIFFSFVLRRRYDLQIGRAPKPRWPVPTKRSRQWTPSYALIAYLATFAAIILISLILSDVVSIKVSAGVGGLVVDAILLLALVPLARRRGISRTDLGIRPTAASSSLGLVLLAVVIYVLVADVYAAIFIGQSLNHKANVLSGIHHLSTLGTIVTIFAVAISAPVVEEIFFRGLIYRSLRNRLPVPVAALIAGLLFGLVHITGYPLITLPIKAIFGVIACLLYERTGSLLPGMGLHSFVDASVVMLAVTGNDYIVLGIALCVSAAIIVRAIRAPAAPVQERDPATNGAPVADATG